MNTSMTGRLRERSAAHALTKVFVMSAACCALLSGSAGCQAPPARAVRGIEAADSLVTAEFAKDSIGSITVGVIATVMTLES